jgi:pyrimidine-nucleoside phosphorylase
MSKKLAAGTRSIVLDVKCGSGAFMQTPEAARELAEAMVGIGRANGRRTAAVITNMDIPLGYNIGNALEVREAIEVLRGGGPDDLREVCLTLAAKMAELSLGVDSREGMRLVREALDSGAAYRKFCEWIARQGGDAEYARDLSLFGESRYVHEVKARSGGYMLSMNAERIGVAAMILGAGRESKESIIDFRAGVVLARKPGDKVETGDTLAVLHTNNKDSLSSAEAKFLGAISMSDEKVELGKLIYKTIR